MVRQITDKDEFDQALKDAGDKVVAVDFTATWCGPCQVIGPIFQSLSENSEYSNIVFLKVDVDDAQDVSGRCKITCMPTFVFFKNGKEVDRFEGANTEKLKQKLSAYK